MTDRQDEEFENEDVVADDLDEQAAGAEDDLNAEDWESYDSEFEEEAGEEAAETAPSGKKSSRFNLVVIGVAAILGLAVLYLNFSSGGKAPAPQQQESAPAGTEEQAAESAPAQDGPQRITAAVTTAPPDSAEEKKPQGGFMNNPDSLDNIVQQSPPMQQQDQSSPPDQVAVTPAEAPPMPAPIAQPVQDALTPLPSSGQPPAQEAAQAPAAPQPAPSSSPAAIVPPSQDASAAAPAQAGADMSAVSARLDQIAAKLGDLESRLAAMEQDRASERDTTNALTARLEKLEAAPVPPPPPAPAAHDGDARAEDRAEPVSSSPEATLDAGAIPLKARKQTAAPRPAAPEKSAVRWVLKSAQPGQAYVSRAGQDDMVSVHVGDTVPGIGKVLSITQTEGRWIVVGSQGSVRQ